MAQLLPQQLTDPTLSAAWRRQFSRRVEPFRMTSNGADVASWREELPALSGCIVALREPRTEDVEYLTGLLSLPDATRFGLDAPITPRTMPDLVEFFRRERAAGLSFTYLVTTVNTTQPVGLIRVRQLDPAFESAEWECTLSPPGRGTGAFLELASLVGSFAFGTVGARRLEARVPLQNGRAMSALRKIGAVQEGVLRQSLRRGGEYLDQALWSVLKDDWTEHRVSTVPSLG
jgi:RimJ/RimL family protein N-acetyltransferase